MNVQLTEVTGDVAKAKTLLVSEVYGPVIQGEGGVIGVPTVFVRLGGCDFKCGQDASGDFTRPFVCDSLYAVLPKFKHEWIKLTADDVFAKVQELVGAPVLITLSGGNPALQDCSRLIYLAHRAHYPVAIETQGTKYPHWAGSLDQITISPKPPSSGMETDWTQLSVWMETFGYSPINLYVKVVIFNDEDFEYAGLVRSLCQAIKAPLFLQAGTSNPYAETDATSDLDHFRAAILSRTEWLSQKVLDARWYDTRVLPQMHALIHGSKRAI